MPRARAHHDGAKLLIAPELALSGYPPEDLLLRPAFYRASAGALFELAAQLKAFPGLRVIVGHPHREHDETPQQRTDPARRAARRHVQRGVADRRRGDRRHLFEAGPAECRGLRREALLRLRPEAVRVRPRRRALRRRDLRGRVACVGGAAREGGGRASAADSERLAVSSQQGIGALRHPARAHPRDRHADGLRESRRRTGRADLRRRLVRARCRRANRREDGAVRRRHRLCRIRRHHAGACGDRRRSVARGAGVPGARGRRARLHRQERLSGRDHRLVGRRRFGARARGRVRCARRRTRARRDDAVALHGRHLHRPTPARWRRASA